jgi:peptidylprolyl isomerase
MRKQLLILAGLILCAAALAACGSSSAPGVVQAPSAGLTQQPVPAPLKIPTDLKTEPAVPMETGPAPKTLQTHDLIVGKGPAAQPGQTVTVNYVGSLYNNGKVFDASWQRHQPFTTPLSAGSVIPGWVQGISGMKVGGRRVLVIPAALAYGKAGRPPTIPPNAPLVFVVDLLRVS